ncbi:MAG: DNA polymerase IV [Eubacteriales bacterium]|nr:DNA polymerase IV [Eubacteriales bacterium]
MDRVILHSDLNNFYASVECLYDPELRGKPVAVCGSQSSRHGIVLAKNYVAKAMGIKTGEVIWQAKQKCPGLIVVHPNFSLYLKFSRLATEIYRGYTDLIEPFGIDESWLDISSSAELFGNGEKIAHEIRNRIREEMGVTVSIGVSFNKVFAKLGSDLKKPDAVTIINQDNFREKIWSLPAKELLYVGRATSKKLDRVGISTIGAIAAAPREFLVNLLGKWGEALWVFANGYDVSTVSRFKDEPVVKGVGNSLTTPRDLVCNEDAKLLFYVLSESVGERLRKYNLKGRTVQISIRDNELFGIERQAKLEQYTYTSSVIAEKAYEIFRRTWSWGKNIRLLGVRCTDLVTADSYMQLSLFPENRRVKRELLDKSVDSIRSRFGHYSVQRALLLKDKPLNVNPAEDHVIHPVAFFKGPVC